MTAPSLILTPRDWDSHPPYCHPGYKSSVLRSPSRPLIPLKENLKDRRVPVYGADDLGKLDHDLTRNAAKNGEPLGERIIVTGRVQYAGRDLASERGRALCSQSRSARGAARSEFPGRWPLPDRQRRAVSLSDDQAGRVPLGQSFERVASQSHPLLAVRRLLRLTSCHADVFPRRPAARSRSDLPGHAGTRAQQVDLALFHRYDRGRVCARL
jgi:hypothetical protein